jgi:hypothetical protein
MNQMDTVLIAVAVVLVVLVGAAMVAGLLWAYFDFRNKQRLMSDAMDRLGSNCSKLAESLTVVTQIPGYLDGLVKVCGDQVAEVVKLSGHVEQFRMSLFGPGKTKDKEDRSAFQPYTDEAADDSYEIQNLVEAGFSVGDATQRVKGGRAGRFNLG